MLYKQFFIQKFHKIVIYVSKLNIIIFSFSLVFLCKLWYNSTVRKNLLVDIKE